MIDKKVFVLISMSIVLAAGTVIPAKAATENDLREVMGIGRLDTDESAKIQALKTIRDCAKDKQHNELVDMLGSYDLEEYTEQMELAEQGESAYENIMSAFISGESAREVTKELSVYETYHNNWQVAPTHISYDLEKIDENDIAKRMKKAEAILATIESNDDIGVVGIDTVTPTKEERLIVTELKDDSVTFQTIKKQKIYGILNGTVESAGTNYVTINCGATIKLTYYGISPSVEEGQRVRQGRKVGTSILDKVKISMMVTDEKENLLLMYGKKGVSWYDDFQDGNAMDYSERVFLETEKVKDYPEESNVSDQITGEPKNEDKLSPFDNKNEDPLLEEDPFIQQEQAPLVTDQTTDKE